MTYILLTNLLPLLLKYTLAGAKPLGVNLVKSVLTVLS